ncbi:acetyltransferase [Longilinea arvoryzae]|uniref:Acetyltransferase n=1 Tax=Longilinea arvoryzae TaxID=360412 RepID=A0A0S7BP86_9CHLR|nr:GNAT family protein [Longilinea arvoryzae]GAP15621.1 acetyltransferase [Longilinea arvoryzae]
MITGSTVRLRAIERQDLPHFVQWLNDPNVNRNLLVTVPLSQAQEDGWFERVLKLPLEEQPLGIEAQTPAGWKLVGNCGFGNIDSRNRSAEIGIFIGDADYWDKGYGTQVLRLLVKYGFNSLNLNRIFLNVFETNPRGIRCYEKAGFVHEGRLRQAIFQDGRYIDMLVMSVLRSEWSDRDI